MWRLDLLGSNAQNPTLPLNLHVPLGEQKKRQATAPARALKDRDVKIEPKTRSSDFSPTWPRKRSSRGIDDQGR